MEPGVDMAGEMAEAVGRVVPELVLLGGAIVALLFALFAPRRLQVGSALIALATSAGSAAVTGWMLTEPETLTFFDTYAADHVAAWAKLIVLAGTALVVGLSVPWFRRDPRHGEYYALLLLSALGVSLLAGATDLMEVVMAILLSSVTGYVLVAFHRRSRSSSEAGVKYFLLGALTSTSMLFGIALLFGLAVSTTFPGLAEGLPERGPALVAGSALVIAGLAFKMGAVPIHAWVPDVAEGAPAPVAAFVTSVPKVGGLIALARLVTVLPETGLGWRPLVALLAAATMTLGNLAALWQDDVRRLLGWSAVSQTGYGLLAVVAIGRSDLDVAALLLFLLAYVLANVAAFGVVVELRGRTELADYDGLARSRPWLAAVLALAFLSFIGIPPLVGFPAKLTLFAAAIDAGYAWLAVLAVANTVVSIFYYARVLGPMYFGARLEPVPVLGRWALVSTSVAGAAVVAAGVVAEPLVRGFMDAALLSGA
jgi:NADH-quinone oxidoreductase subunit N